MGKIPSMVGPRIKSKCLGVSKMKHYREKWSRNITSQLPSLVLSPKSANAHAAEPNVRVRVRRRIVQIERERTGVRSIVPIATPKRSAPRGAREEIEGTKRERIDFTLFLYQFLP